MVDRPVHSDKVALKEIEVSPEIIDEGVRLLFNYDPDYSNERDIVRMIIDLVLEKAVNPKEIRR
jgi:hypothetical protein